LQSEQADHGLFADTNSSRFDFAVAIDPATHDETTNLFVIVFHHPPVAILPPLDFTSIIPTIVIAGSFPWRADPELKSNLGLSWHYQRRSPDHGSGGGW